MPNVALNVGANRILAGAAITSPLGAPSLPRDREQAFRRELVRQALGLLAKNIEEQTLVHAETTAKE